MVLNKLRNNKNYKRNIFLDLGGSTVSSLELGLYKKIREALNLKKTNIKPFSHFFSLVDPEDDVCNILGLNFKRIISSYKIKKNNGKYFDEYGITWTENKSNLEVINNPIKSLSRETVKKLKLPHFKDWDRLKATKETIGNYLDSEYFLVGDVWCTCIITLMMRLIGYSNFLEYTITKKSLLRELFEKLTDHFNEFADGFLIPFGRYFDVVVIGDDLGSQQNLLFSPRSYRELIKPFHKKIIDNIKKRTKAKILFHTCGSVYDLIPDLIEIGVDILNPVQITANKMNPGELMKNFGKDIMFWGGLDTQQVITFGNKDRIYTEVENLFNIFENGEMYVFSCSHNLIGNIDPENIIMAFLHAKKLRDKKTQ